MYNPGSTGFLLKEDEAKTNCSGIITSYLVFWLIMHTDILLVAHIFPRNNMQLVKYQCILSTKTPNKVYECCTILAGMT